MHGLRRPVHAAPQDDIVGVKGLLLTSEIDAIFPGTGEKEMDEDEKNLPIIDLSDAKPTEVTFL